MGGVLPGLGPPPPRPRARALSLAVAGHREEVGLARHGLRRIHRRRERRPPRHSTRRPSLVLGMRQSYSWMTTLGGWREGRGERGCGGELGVTGVEVLDAGSGEGLSPPRLPSAAANAARSGGGRRRQWRGGRPCRWGHDEEARSGGGPL
jgi:hypothetical protein